MKLLFRQRVFSWFDSYDIYDEWGNTVYTVRGQLSWGHLLKIYDARGNGVGTVRERILTFLPKFEMYLGNRCVGCVRTRFSLFRPVFDLDCNGWRVEGNWFEWDYTIRSARGTRVATISKQLFRWSDTYVIDIADPNHALCTLMVVLAIDAEKCSRNR